MTKNKDVSEPIFEMDLMKKFQMMCSWSEFYLMNKNKIQHDKIQKTINELRLEITYRNTGIKQ